MKTRRVFLLVAIALLNSFIETDYAMISSLHPAALASVVPISIGCPKWLCDSINLSGVRYTEGHHHWLTFLSLSVASPNTPQPICLWRDSSERMNVSGYRFARSHGWKFPDRKGPSVQAGRAGYIAIDQHPRRCCSSRCTEAHYRDKGKSDQCLHHQSVVAI